MTVSFARTLGVLSLPLCICLAPETAADSKAARLPAPVWQEAKVSGLVGGPDDGVTIFLSVASAKKVIPIGIGVAEARAIYLRHKKEKFERPLTHDLLDSIVGALGARVTRIEVTEIRSVGTGGAFIARVYLKAKDGRDIDVDARTSDAIALALGSGLPIFVAASVTESSGVPMPSDGLTKAPAGETI